MVARTTILSDFVACKFQHSGLRSINIEIGDGRQGLDALSRTCDDRHAHGALCHGDSCT